MELPLTMNDCGLPYHPDYEPRCRGACSFPCWPFLQLERRPAQSITVPHLSPDYDAAAQINPGREVALQSAAAFRPLPAPPRPPARANVSVPACHQDPPSPGPGAARAAGLIDPPLARTAAGPSPSDRSTGGRCVFLEYGHESLSTTSSLIHTAARGRAHPLCCSAIGVGRSNDPPGAGLRSAVCPCEPASPRAIASAITISQQIDALAERTRNLCRMLAFALPPRTAVANLGSLRPASLGARPGHQRGLTPLVFLSALEQRSKTGPGLLEVASTQWGLARSPDPHVHDALR